MEQTALFKYYSVLLHYASVPLFYTQYLSLCVTNQVIFINTQEIMVIGFAWVSFKDFGEEIMGTLINTASTSKPI